MKNLLKFLIIFAMVATAQSCTTVDSGHKGVEVSYGGKTNLEKVYTEGMATGLKWLYTDMVEYDVREKTIVEVFEFNDKNNMPTKVEFSLDYCLDPDKVNLLHSKITDVETKIIKTLKSAGKEVVPQYSAIELNINKRKEAEDKLAKIVSEELPEFYVLAKRIQMTDVDLPLAVSKLATETATQIGRNELAKKKEAEEVALAQAKIAKSKGDFEAAEYDAKTKTLMSAPAVLQLKKLEVEMEWAKKGVSPYGNNNVFGSNTAIVKGLK